MRTTLAIAGLILALATAPARAQAAADDVTLLRNTVANLLEALVKQGLLTPEAASRLVSDAQAKASSEAADPADAPAPGDVRVTYVPEVVREQIAAEVQAAVGEAVVADVKAQARAEGWGVPAALPEWVRRMRWTGELRARTVGILYDDGNDTAVPNYQVINLNRGTAGLGQEGILNTTEDETLLQVRLLLGATVDFSRNITGGFSIATGNQLNPLTRNQDISNYGQSRPILLDELFLLYRTSGERERHHFSVRAGRFDNPYRTTELLWDNDFRLGGLTLRYGSGSPSQGMPGGPFLAEPAGFFATVGAYQLDADAFSSSDKWLYAGQFGYEMPFGQSVTGSLAVAWWHFDNITGRRNPEGTTLFDFTAPAFLQKGNTLFDISNDADPQTQRWALAAEYQVLHLNTTWSWFINPNLQATFVGEWIRNLGYDQAEVLERIGTSNASLVPDRERSTGYRLEWRIGRPDIARALAWRFTFGYTYAERDAWVDAFSDGNIRRGGTDNEGFILAAELGVADNSWLRLRYFTADEIDGAPLGIDVIQFGWWGRF